MAFQTASDFRAFALAGKAIVTAESHRTGDHYTFKIERGRRGGDFYFVGVLTGSDNQHDYSSAEGLRAAS